MAKKTEMAFYPIPVCLQAGMIGVARNQKPSSWMSVECSDLQAILFFWSFYKKTHQYLEGFLFNC